MSKAAAKPKKRKSSVSVDAAVLVPLGAVREGLEDPAGISPALTTTHTSSILHLVTHRASERKALVHKSTAGIEILLRCLQVGEDYQVVWNTANILNCLSQHKHNERLIKEGAVPILLSSLSSVAHCSWCSDSLLLVYHSLLARLGPRDKKFAVKARLSGVLPVTAGLLKRCQGERDLSTVLSVVKVLTSNATNAVSLGKQGCLSVMSKLLGGTGKKDFVVLKRCVEVLAALLKQKSNASKPAAQSCLRQLVSLHQHLHHVDRQCRHIPLRRALLNTLKNTVGIDECLQVFHKANGLQILYTCASEISEAKSKDLRSLATLTCTVLRKCLPRSPLPISTQENPIKFTVPRKPDEAAFHHRLHTSLSAPQLTQELPQTPVTQEPMVGLTELKVSEQKQQTTLLCGTVQKSSGPSTQTSGSSLELFETAKEQYSSEGAAAAIPSIVLLPPHNALAADAKIELKEFDEFFPELGGLSTVKEEKRCKGLGTSVMHRARSSPELQLFKQTHSSVNPESGIHSMQQCEHLDANTDQEQSRDLFQKDFKGNMHSSMPDIPSEQEVSAIQFDPSDPEGTIAQPPLPTIVVPTATSVSMEAGVDVDDSGIVFRAPPTHHSRSQAAPDRDEGAQSDVLKSVLKFQEQPLYQVMRCTPPPEPEPLYKKAPAVDRRLILQDTARYIHPKSLINQTVFDLDEIVSSEDKTEGVTGAETATPQDVLTSILQPTRVRSASSLQENRYLSVTRCLTPSQSSPGILESPSHSMGQTSASSEARDLFEQREARLHLHFDSQFESGNLRKAIQVHRYEYDLLLNCDINTDHHHQWFYFKVSNTEAGPAYRFNIINCEKPNSQFNFGMQPLLYSVTEGRQGRPHWLRAGGDVSYHRNNFVLEGRKKSTGEGSSSSKSGQKACYTLTFTVVFLHSDDTCYLAYHYPYTYSMLQGDLHDLEDKLFPTNVYYVRQSLCSTLGGNSCPLLTITSREEPPEGEKQYVVLSARVHPGESNSSWIMRGVLQFLFSDEPSAQILRSRFVFKVVPMLNPDGVINGSHRCSLTGQDLNRQWIAPDPVLHPTIYHTKGLIQWLVAHGRSPFVYCDFHGHSRRKDVFMYGCRDPTGSRVEEVLPRLLDGIAPAFSLKPCSFVVEKSKEATARVVVWRQLGVQRSYTMESTYCSTDQGPYKGRQITTQDLEEMGHYFCLALKQLEEQPFPLTELDSDHEGDGTIKHKQRDFKENASSYSEDSYNESVSDKSLENPEEEPHGSAEEGEGN